MSDYKPVKIKRKKRADQKLIRELLFRALPIALVVIIAVASFAIFDKRIGEILSEYKYATLDDRGQIDDPMLDTYDPLNIDWSAAYTTSDKNGFDPLLLSPLTEVGGSRPSGFLTSTEFERALGYTNKQALLWSINETVNKDVTAWIYMYGMGINYPIAEENGKEDYYLRRHYDGTQSNSGTIFTTSPCKINPVSRNLILHGHNMRDGTMFATLTNYLKGTKEFYEAHRYIFLDTLYGTYRYEIYSVYQCVPADIYLQVNFASNTSFLSWLTETNNRGRFKSDTTTFTPEDRILTLSTCDASNKYRIVVHAKMVYPTPVGDVDSEIVYLPDVPDYDFPELPDDMLPDGSTPTPETPEDEGTVTPPPSEPQVPTPPAEENIYADGTKFRIKLTDTKSTLRLRSQPSTNSVIVAALAHGTGVTVIAEHNEWVQVTTEGGMEGYLQKRFLVPESEFEFTTPTDEIKPPSTNLITPTPETTTEE